MFRSFGIKINMEENLQVKNLKSKISRIRGFKGCVKLEDMIF